MIAAAFLAHGSPFSALGGDAHARALRAFGDAHSDVKAILVVSAHWQTQTPPAVTAWNHAPLIYDFGGFPDELYRIEYPAPGDPALAARVANLLSASALAATLERTRGLDHGAWVPLRLAWPSAAHPVLQVSLPAVKPSDLFALGRALRPLREEGVLIAGSGGIVHNLRRLSIQDKDAAPESWAVEFDRWVAERVADRDYDSLFQYREKAPHAALAVPTSEHFDPLFVALGAGFEEEAAKTIFEGFHYSTISMRSISFG
jgi:4,5-DOPA dioxygenase extradiol